MIKTIKNLSAILLLFIACSSNDIDTVSQLYAKGELEKAFEISSKLIEKDTLDPVLTMMHGRILVDLHKYEEGNRFLKKAIDFNDEPWISAWALAYLGQSYYMTKDYEESEKSLRACLKLDATKNVNEYANKRMLLFGFSNYFDDWRIVETDHIKFYLQTPSDITDIQSFIDRREDAFSVIAETFECNIPKKIDFYVWNDEIEPLEKFNISLGFADPEKAIIYSHRNQTAGHELTHIITHYSGEPNKVKTGLINEGVAVCFNQNGKQTFKNLQNISKASLGDKVYVEKLWKNWQVVNNSISYPVAGLFVNELINEFGMPKFKELLVNQTYDNALNIYGDELIVFISNFEKKIDFYTRQRAYLPPTVNCVDTTISNYFTSVIKTKFKEGHVTLCPIIVLDEYFVSSNSPRLQSIKQEQIKQIRTYDKNSRTAIGLSKEEGSNGAILFTTHSLDSLKQKIRSSELIPTDTMSLATAKKLNISSGTWVWIDGQKSTISDIKLLSEEDIDNFKLYAKNNNQEASDLNTQIEVFLVFTNKVYSTQ